jgi:molybdopterin converting factor small subunit
MTQQRKTITVRYFALFRENAGVAEETISTDAHTAGDVFEETRPRHSSSEPTGHCKVAINDEMAEWDSPVNDGDSVLLFPPVAGG